jgi:DNA helicase II / ATP-dependent DNA helicase PcrA
MIDILDLYRALSTFRPPPDAQQRQAIEPPSEDGLFIVAGPGTGKTTGLTLRILKLVLVDAVPPRGILATTFTRKAAEELRSRILGWGFKLIDALSKDAKLCVQKKEYVRSIDINQLWTGTIDSLSEQLLRDFRAPGTQPPILVDDFVSRTLMLREGLFGSARHNDSNLNDFLLGLHSDNRSNFGFHVGAKTNLLMSLWERRFQDQVNWASFISGGTASEATARKLVGDAHDAYETALRSATMVDFSLLEDEVLHRLTSSQLDDFTKDLRVVLVDEYQDSNLMQELIYFELAKACKGAFTVVGDDDQSLYRFRGATVDLFRNFSSRYQAHFGSPLKTVFLTNNYRSTDQVIDLTNSYASLDTDYQTVRVAGKPPLSKPLSNSGLPIIGMFRPTIDDLARDLAGFIHDIFRGRGHPVPGHGVITKDPSNGDVGDCALLCSSPGELAANDRPRLPLRLRQELGALNPPLQVFNPRGENFAGIELVSRFGGLLAECLDLGGVIQSSTSGIAPNADAVLRQWRSDAEAYVMGASSPSGLQAYAASWATRDPARSGFDWPRSVTAIDLIYSLVHFFPGLHDDPEGQIYLEVFTRQLAACEQIGEFGGRVVHDLGNPGLSDASVRELLRDFLAPIAGGLIKINEDLMESFPRDRLSILSVHQSKGLEFPLAIVDVGSEFRTRHHATRFKRYPSAGGPPHRFEDLVRPYSALGTPTRTQVNRAFDDLYRQSFVAFSRPQDLLLLVGINSTAPGGPVENIATGWDRDGVCHWAPPNVPYIDI